MSYDIRKPMITESTERGQLLQIKSYLIQLVDQLNYTLRMLEDRANKGTSVEGTAEIKLPPALFAEIKSLIMKSSDIINAYYEKMEPKFGEKIEKHNTADDSHADIRALIEKLTKKLGELEDGVDGVSPTVEVSKTGSVTTITITDVNGTQTATINDGYTPVKGVDYFDGKDGKDGTNGKDGYTPVKGTDYYTEADKNEMVSMVLAALPTWSGGSY